MTENSTKKPDSTAPEWVHRHPNNLPTSRTNGENIVPQTIKDESKSRPTVLPQSR